jgi:adenine-specific DNA methylase
LALAWIRKAIDRVKDETIKNLLRLAFSNTLLHVSKLKAENVRPMAVNNYWVPDDWIEENVWYRFSERVKLIYRGKKIAQKRIDPKAIEKLHIYNHTATELYMLSSESVDYILTDPPYGDSIQYSELSRIWNAWLGNQFLIDEEIIINPTQDKGHLEYENLLTDAFKEMYRVLKEGRWLTLCFHNKEFATWNAILSACRRAGFHYANAVPQKPLSQSFTQAWAKNSPKTDLFVNLYKPRKVQTDIIDEPTLREFSLRDVVSAVCDELPDSAKVDLNIVYDKVVIKLVEYAFLSSQQLNPKEYSIYKVRELLTEGTFGIGNSECGMRN